MTEPELKRVERPGTHVHYRRTDDGRYEAEFWQNPSGRGRGGIWHIKVTDTHTRRSLESAKQTTAKQDDANLAVAYRLLQRLIAQSTEENREHL